MCRDQQIDIPWLRNAATPNWPQPDEAGAVSGGRVVDEGVAPLTGGSNREQLGVVDADRTHPGSRRARSRPSRASSDPSCTPPGGQGAGMRTRRGRCRRRLRVPADPGWRASAGWSASGGWRPGGVDLGVGEPLIERSIPRKRRTEMVDGRGSRLLAGGHALSRHTPPRAVHFQLAAVQAAVRPVWAADHATLARAALYRRSAGWGPGDPVCWISLISSPVGNCSRVEHRQGQSSGTPRGRAHRTLCRPLRSPGRGLVQPTAAIASLQFRIASRCPGQAHSFSAPWRRDRTGADLIGRVLVRKCNARPCPTPGPAQRTSSAGQRCGVQRSGRPPARATSTLSYPTPTPRLPRPARQQAPTHGTRPTEAVAGRT